MISIKKVLDELECQALLHAALEAYRGLLVALQEHAFSLPETEEQPPACLSDLRKRLSQRPTVEDLQAGRQMVEQELRRHKQRLQVAFEKQRREVQQILAALAEAAGVLERRHAVHNSNLSHFTRQLESLSRVESLAEIRRRLAAQVSQMKVVLQQAYREQEEAISQLRRELEIFRSRLQHAEQLAATDPLTGLANRRECDRRLAELMASGEPFSVMLLDLDRFKQLNDNYGHYVGDQVLALFAQRLREQFRASDLVARWGGDEFMAIVACPLEVAQQKASEVSQRVNGWYTVASPDGHLHVYVRASVGVAGYRPGESLEQLYARVDELLYADKAAHSTAG